MNYSPKRKRYVFVTEDAEVVVKALDGYDVGREGFQVHERLVAQSGKREGEESYSFVWHFSRLSSLLECLPRLLMEAKDSAAPKIKDDAAFVRDYVTAIEAAKAMVAAFEKGAKQ